MAQLTGPRNPTETDPRAPEVTRTENLAKNEIGIFGTAGPGGAEKSFAMYLEKNNLTIFNGQKNFPPQRQIS